MGKIIDALTGKESLISEDRDYISIPIIEGGQYMGFDLKEIDKPNKKSKKK